MTKPGEHLSICATASAFESVGFDMPSTPTSSATTGPTRTEDARDPVSEDTWLRIGGHGPQAYAKRIFETGWFEGISREKDRNGRTLQEAWAAFCKREGLVP